VRTLACPLAILLVASAVAAPAVFVIDDALHWTGPVAASELRDYRFHQNVALLIGLFLAVLGICVGRTSGCSPAEVINDFEVGCCAWVCGWLLAFLWVPPGVPWLAGAVRIWWQWIVVHFRGN